MSKRSRKKVGETSLAFLPFSGVNAKLWKPKFSTCELGRQVTMVDSTKDHDTSMALARAVMLPNDVISLSEENLKTINDLLLIQQVQVSILALVFFELLILYLMFLCVFAS